MRVGIAATMLVALALAGCSEDAMIPEEDDTFQDFDATATEDTGIIRGVVVDPAINPIAGVTITILSTEQSTTTNENGAFAFQDLAPGSYFLEAVKPGFESIQASANVEANVNEPPIVKMQLVPDPSTLPFAQGMVYDAYIQCSESLLLVGYAGGCFNDFLVDYGPAELGDTPDFAQSEMAWESTQPLGDWMTLLYSAPGNGTLLDNYQDVEGPSPLTVKADKALMESYGVIHGYPLQIRIFNSGLEGTDLGRDYGDPVDGDNCIERPALGGCTTGLGATLEQQLTVYTYAFYNFQPEEGWTFIEAGPPQA